MTTDEIIAMATEAGLNSYRIAPGEAVAAWERFAALVADSVLEDADRAMRAAQPAGAQQPDTSAALPVLAALVSELRKHRFCGDCYPESGWPGVNNALAQYAAWKRASHGQAPAGAADPQLCKFYGVTTGAELIAAQAAHIERLQAKLPQAPSFAPQRAREG